MKPEDFIRGLLDFIEGKEDHTNWIQVAKLDGDDLLQMAEHHKKADQLASEIKMHRKIIESLSAQGEALGAEWWHHIRVKHRIPPGNLTIEGGRVLMEPERKR